MKPSRMVLPLALLLFGAVGAPSARAEDAPKTLPTLVIKGEVVSVDTNDPTVSVLKVKDRYGFETPIHLTADTKIAQGEQAVAASDLTAGSTVEVEYNFDINTAKRHAVRVAIGQAAASATTPEPAPAAAEPLAASTTVSTEIVMSPKADVPASADSAAPETTAPAAEPVAAEPAAAESAPAPQ